MFQMRRQLMIGVMVSAILSLGFSNAGYSRNMEVQKMEIESASFGSNQPIPKKHTCDGEDRSPALSFTGAPKGTKSFALIVDDPDAPSGTFTHWVGWNIDPERTTLSEGEQIKLEGVNDFGKIGYRGPCPPRGNPHRYFFKIYALDTLLNLPKGSSKGALEKAMDGHILGKGELVGTYQRR